MVCSLFPFQSQNQCHSLTFHHTVVLLILHLQRITAVFVSRSDHNKSPQTRCFVLKTGGWNDGAGGAVLPMRLWGGEFLPLLFQLLVAPGIPCLGEAQLPISASRHLHMAFFSVCLSVPSPLFIRTPVIWFRAQSKQYDLCKSPIFKWGHTLSFWVDMDFAVGGYCLTHCTHFDIFIDLCINFFIVFIPPTTRMPSPWDKKRCLYVHVSYWHKRGIQSILIFNKCHEIV